MKYTIITFLVAAFIAQTTIVKAQKNRFYKERLARIDTVVNKHIAASHIPGASVLIIKNGEVVYQKAFGYADVEKKAQMKTDAIFRIASQSKAITSLAVMILWERGKFQLDDPISKYIMAFKDPKVLIKYNAKDGSYTTRPASREITVRDLLRHTSGIAYPAIFSDPTMWSLYEKAAIPSGIGTMASTVGDKMKLLARLPLQHDPGERFTYGLNIDLLGYLIEIWSGEPLDQFLMKNVLIPLEMNDTYFHIPEKKQDRLVSLYETTAENKLVKVNHPIYEGVNAEFPKMQGTYLSGGAGLSATAGDLAKFYSLFLSKGLYKGKRIISPSTVKLMLTNQLGGQVVISPLPPQPENFQFALGGFALVTEKNAYLSPRNIGSFGWGGAFNTHGWADPKEGIIALLMTQEYLSPWYSIGEDFQTAIYQAITD